MNESPLPCSPLAPAAAVAVVKEFESSQIIDDWRKHFEIDISGELGSTLKIRLLRCTETGLLFFDPPTVAGSHLVYAGLQKFAWYYMPEKWEHRCALSRLKPTEKLMEVGGGDGFFVQVAIEKGIHAQGIEINQAAVAKAVSLGRPVEDLDLEVAATRYNGAMDAVCAFQVLEHIAAPLPFLTNCLAMLKPGGRLMLAVPNAESFLRLQRNLLDMPPHHMARWSAQAFASLEKLLPVRLIKIEKESLAEYHVKAFVEVQLEAIKRKIPHRFHQLLQRNSAVLERVLNLGLRRFFTGQSLYVEFQKI